LLLSVCLAALFGLASPDPDPPPARRVAVALPESWESADLARWTAFARREGLDPLSADPGASFAALSAERWWKGVYWWKAFSDGRDAVPSDSSFNFLGRPAGEAIAAGFRRLAAAGGGTR